MLVSATAVPLSCSMPRVDTAMAAAILGMIPIAPTIFWGPMAYAIMGGLAVATALTLVFLPALYVAWFRINEPSPPEVHSVDLSDQIQQTSTAPGA